MSSDNLCYLCSKTRSFPDGLDGSTPLSRLPSRDGNVGERASITNLHEQGADCGLISYNLCFTSSFCV